MSSYLWSNQFRCIHNKSLDLYRQGNRNLEGYFNTDEKSFLSSIGLHPGNLYDWAEDMDSAGEPDWNTVLLIAAVRRDYFLVHQKGVACISVTEALELPPKPEELAGIPWLPRIIAKATCFLQGGLCNDIMYGCGGDRRFLKEHDIHPADFLRAVWASGGDESRILAFVQERMRSGT